VRPAHGYAPDRCHRSIGQPPGTLEHDQRALLLNTKTLQRVLCRVEIDLIDHEVWPFLLDLLDDRTLLPAGRTPGGRYIDEDRFAGCLGLLERLVVE